MSDIRTYRLRYKVPPLTFHDYEKRLVPAPGDYPYAYDAWTEIVRDVKAFTGHEAVERLEVLLIGEWYSYPGRLDFPIYWLLDIEPVETPR